MFSVRLILSLIFTITLTSWKEKMKVLLIASLVRGALFKESSWRFWKVSTEVWGAQSSGVWLISENSKEAVESSREKRSHTVDKLHFHPQNEQGYECVFHKPVCWYMIREIERKWLEAILAGSWPKTTTWKRTGVPVWRLPDTKELKGHPTPYKDEFLRNL